MAAADVGSTKARAAPLHPAFAALAPWFDDRVDSKDAGEAMSLDRLNAIASGCMPPPVSERGAAIRFVAPRPTASAIEYESRILSGGQVATRPGNRHDVFNALCWIAFPRVKRACNALHVAQAAANTHARGALRDALTLFDESGVIALCADTALGELLAARQWKALFSERRDAAVRALRFFVCGHALYEKLLDPYPGITGRVLVVPVTAEAFDGDAATQRAAADAGAAGLLHAVRAATDIPPLPLAGIPGWDPRNAEPGFYDDARIFRAPRLPPT